jgi:hypothetical protein
VDIDRTAIEFELEKLGGKPGGGVRCGAGGTFPIDFEVPICKTGGAVGDLLRGLGKLGGRGVFNTRVAVTALAAPAKVVCNDPCGGCCGGD